MEEPCLERLATLFKALADPVRLRLLGLLAERPLAGHEIADRLGLTPPTVSHHVRRLSDAGLIAIEKNAQSRIYSLRAGTLRDWSQLLSAADDPSTTEREEDAVIRAFFDGPVLRQVPASRKKRVVVLHRLLQRFRPGRDYPEREVNDLLREAHPDVATLRRELVDYGFLTRDRGVYRVASELPDRGATVLQEVGDESNWFPEFVANAAARVMAEPAPAEIPAAKPSQTA
jgi:DNA-binding transcriptional ArsR family regulator